MIGSKWRLLVLGVLVAGVIGMNACPANAGWHPWMWGGTPYLGIGGAPCCGPFGGCYYDWCARPGPVHRLLVGPYCWYSTCWGYTWNGCCWDACCEPIVDCCGPAAGPVVGVPAAGPTVAPAPALPAPPPPGSPAVLPPAPSAAPPPAPPKPAPPPAPEAEAPTPPPANQYNPPPPGPQAMSPPTRANSGLLTIWVPADAKVLINGLPTLSTGSKREYLSHGLKPGFTYQYEICAQIVRDGHLVEEVQVVHLTAGCKEGVAFGFNPKPPVEVAAR